MAFATTINVLYITLLLYRSIGQQRSQFDPVIPGEISHACK